MAWINRPPNVSQVSAEHHASGLSATIEAVGDPAQTARLQEEIRSLATERGAVILAHCYQRPEVQDVADFVGDILSLSHRAAASSMELIAFCGVRFMAETASVLGPQKTVLLPDLACGCSLADTITAADVRAWRDTRPKAVVVMCLSTSAEVKAEADYCCTSSNAVAVVEHVWREHGPDTQILFGPDMWLGAYVEDRTGRPMLLWRGGCHVHAGIKPQDIEQLSAAHPQAELLVHPECGCTTSVMEFFSSGDLDAGRCRMLSTGAILDHVRHSRRQEFILATETGMLHPLRRQNTDKRFIPLRQSASCRFMKAITLPKLRDCLRDLAPQVRVEKDIAQRARIPIERMIAISVS
jgi:quinolinate synthase